MRWLALYFAIGWLCLVAGVFQYRATGLPRGVGSILFFLWPIVLPSGLWEAWKIQKKRRREEKQDG